MSKPPAGPGRRGHSRHPTPLTMLGALRHARGGLSSTAAALSGFPLTVSLGSALSVRTFHQSGMDLGRKSGSKFLEFPVRPPSKKQIQRRKTRKEEWAAKRNPAKEILARRVLLKQVDSPKFDAMIKETSTLLDSVSELFLPGAMDEFRKDLIGEEEPPKTRLSVNPNEVIVLLQNINRASPGTIVDVDTIDPPTPTSNSLAEVGPELATKANACIEELLERGEPSKVRTVFMLVREHKLKLSADVAAALIRHAADSKISDYAKEVFEYFMSTDETPTVAVWAARALSLTATGNLEDAKALIVKLQAFGLNTCALHNSVLRGLLWRRELATVEDYWLEMHKQSVPFDSESFALIMEAAAYQGKVERAFFYLDELRSLRLQPTLAVFESLFIACGYAPVWVKGYENIVFDAMVEMEKAELLPTTSTYNAILRAFAKVGDCISAEYYFWEMKRKGLAPDELSYSTLLDSYAHAQTIGAKDFGRMGRYLVKPETLSVDEHAARELGAERLLTLTSQSLTSDTEAKSGKRIKSVIRDFMSDDPDAQKAVQDQIRREGVQRRLERLRYEDELAAQAAGQPLPAEEESQEELDDNADVEMTEKMLLELFKDRTAHSQPSYVTKMRERGATFADPFTDLPGLKGLRNSSNIAQGALESSVQEQRSALELLDAGNVDGKYMETLRSQVDPRWDMFTFGRAPPPSYYYSHLLPLSKRRRMHKTRAAQIYDHFLRQGLRPTATLLTNLLGVSAAAGHVDDAYKAQELFVQRKIQMTPKAHEYLVQGHLMNKNLPAALEVIGDMDKIHVVPTPETYGYVIRSMVSRGNLVEALKVLEDAGKKRVVIKDAYLRHLRNRCTNLGIQHPLLPADPNAWVKEVKTLRRQRKHTSRRKVQELESVMWN